MPGIRILHEDEDVIGVEKAAGVLAQEVDGAYSVEGALTDYVRKGQWKSARRVYLVHRLDGRTSGVMMVAKNERAQMWLRDHWNEVTTKNYLARVEGVLDARETFRAERGESQRRQARPHGVASRRGAGDEAPWTASSLHVRRGDAQKRTQEPDPCPFRGGGTSDRGGCEVRSRTARGCALPSCLEARLPASAHRRTPVVHVRPAHMVEGSG